MAGAFSKIKELYKLQKEAKEMQKKMKEKKISGLSKDEHVEIIIDGTQEILEINISDDLMSLDRKKDLEKEIKQAMEEAQKLLRKEMTKDMDIDKLKGMLGS
ncbi:YbaB/EbfC family nucleoid-associated protein [Candidatus Dojkabacteria bacterium]|nr:YbaB/EbfC family nucleoid-associated protein [Candidatus Dojkabacteria bacterium]